MNSYRWQQMGVGDYERLRNNWKGSREELIDYMTRYETVCYHTRTIGAFDRVSLECHNPDFAPSGWEVIHVVPRLRREAEERKARCFA